MINYEEDLLNIFKEDNDQILNTPVRPLILSKDQKLLDSFSEIISFVKINEREPQSGDDISERKLAARLAQIKADPELIKTLKPFDDQNLLGEIKEINSNKKDGDYNIALLNLKFRNFEDVWDFYDLRWKIKQTYFNTKKPELKKLPSTFKKLFIWREQGIGDQIFFSNLIHNFAPFFESIITPDPIALVLNSFCLG